MNKHLLIAFLLIPFSFFAMEKETIYQRIAVSAEKKDVTTDLTFEDAKDVIERECQDGHLKYWLKAFACTYLRRKEGKTYNQMKQELDAYSYESESNALTKFFVPKFVSIMKKAIDNWDTQNPHNVFKYVDDQKGILNFLEDYYFLGLQNPRKTKDKQQ